MAIPQNTVVGGTYPAAVRIWLFTGVFMIFMQVVIGGITRLTGSGLSITKWEIVTGTLPPLNAATWEQEFALYKQTPQYQKINEGMSLSDFKFIYFWEYFHRLWARLMGFVFAIPFFIFWRKGWLDKKLKRQLGIVVLLAALVASFGWIMVASGLVNRPWVNAYKLTMHLSLAFLTYGYLFWVALGSTSYSKIVFHNPVLKKWTRAIFFIVCVQIILGGLMSGMKAALSYPTWPLMQGGLLPDVLLDSANWKWIHFTDYDRHTFMPALVQVLHRFIAYLLFFSGLWYSFKGLRRVPDTPLHNVFILFAAVLLLQVVLGILTLIYSVGIIPVELGVLHQAGALILLSVIILLLFLTRDKTAA